MRQIAIVTGSNRTGTSLLASLLVEQHGFHVPGTECSDATEYRTFECEEFRRLSRRWNWEQAERFAASLGTGKVILKYPKSSRVIKQWLTVIPDARVMYVFRPREEAVESQIRNWWGARPCRWFARCIYRYQWDAGLSAMGAVQAPIAFYTFRDLQQTRSVRVPSDFEWEA
jgi:hypothetical protein